MNAHSQVVPAFAPRAAARRRRAHGRLRACPVLPARRSRRPLPAPPDAFSIRKKSMPSLRSMPTAPSRCSPARSISAKACGSRSRRSQPKNSASPSTRCISSRAIPRSRPIRAAPPARPAFMRGGMQIRQAAATARKGLIELAAKRLNVPAESCDRDGIVRPAAGGAGSHVCRTPRRQKFRSQARSESAAEESDELHAGRQVAEAAGHRRRNAPAATSICRTSPCRTCCMRA